MLQSSGERVSEDRLHEMLREVDLAKNANVNLAEFLQVRGHGVRAISRHRRRSAVVASLWWHRHCSVLTVVSSL